MGKRKPKIGRLIIAIAIYIAIGLIPAKLSRISVDNAKSALATKLLAENRSYPAEAYAVLVKSADEPSYAGDQIHVWDSDGKGGRPYNTYVGGGWRWRTNYSYIAYGYGEETAKIILYGQNARALLNLLSFAWYTIIPIAFLCMLFEDEAKKEE